MIRVLIVEDDPMVRKLLEIYIGPSDRYELVPSVESAVFAEFCCRTSQVDLILMLAIFSPSSVGSKYSSLT